MNELGGRTWKLGGELEVRRVGFGAMRLTGPQFYGPPADVEGAKAVLRAAVEAGVNHIDTAGFYGPDVTNEIIRDTLKPYAKDLVIVTKVGNRRGADKSWPEARTPKEIREDVEGNLRTLGVEALDVVNLRMGGPMGPAECSIADAFEELGQLKQDGKIRHLGLSNVTAAQLKEGLEIDDVVCVQNGFSVVNRKDAAMVRACAEQGIAYVPFFPLGGGRPLRNEAVDGVASESGKTKWQVALAWLLEYSPNILLIPGTGKVGHLMENLGAGSVGLTGEMMGKLG